MKTFTVTLLIGSIVQKTWEQAGSSVSSVRWNVSEKYPFEMYGAVVTVTELSLGVH